MAAVRNLARNRLYSGISVFSLAVGLCAAILVAAVLRSELSYERFLPGYERTYLAAAVGVPSGHPPLYDLISPSFVAQALKSGLREVEAVTRIAPAQVRLRHGAIEAREMIYWADPNAFDLLRLPVLAGDLNTALSRADGMVVTRSIARKYFGRDAPIGESIQLDRGQLMTITAVIEDLPVNRTKLETGVFASGLAANSELAQCDRDVPEMLRKGGLFLCGRTYLRLAPAVRLDQVQQAVNALVERLYPRLPGIRMALQIIRIDQVHLTPELSPGIEAQMAVVGAVGVLILLASCIVFVNLSTARATRRAREVGIRKVCGASRAILIGQFLGEALLYVGLASCIALSLAECAFPAVNAFLNSAGSLEFLRQPAPALGFVLGMLLIAALAGCYPAFVLSAFRPAEVLKGPAARLGGAAARQALVIVQFAILIGFLAAAAVVYEQRSFATHEALRVNTDQMLIIRAPCGEALMNELRALGGVRGAYCSSSSLLDRMMFCNCHLRDGTPLAIDLAAVQFGALRLYGIKPVAGDLPADTAGTDSAQRASRVVINETAARRLGFNSASAAVGQVLPLADGPQQLSGFTRAGPPEAMSGEIVAVVPDFWLDSVEQAVRPTIYAAAARNYQIINAKLTGEEIPETLAAIDRLLKATGSEDSVERFFLSEYLQNLYLVVLREAQAFAVFAAIAVALASLGLFGLAAATAERRTKEIGIRKAMGAGSREVLRMLLWQFTRPVLWASLLAWPVSVLLLNRWLEGFAYHVSIPAWVLPGASAAALAIALATVSAHAVLVSRAAPTAALRCD